MMLALSTLAGKHYHPVVLLEPAVYSIYLSSMSYLLSYVENKSSILYLTDRELAIGNEPNVSPVGESSAFSQG
jgi:hypothetical protein